jgi:hypothetical protein
MKTQIIRSINKHILRWVFLISLLLLTACVSDSGQSLLKTDCDLPCWNGVTPGQTNKDEFLNILQKLPSVNKKSIIERGPSLGTFDSSIYFDIYSGISLWPTMHALGSFQGNTLSVLEFYDGNPGLNFGEIIKATVNPEWVITVGSITGKPLIRVINATKGIAFGNTMGNLKEITPETPIDLVILFDPTQFDALLDSGMFSDGNYSEARLRGIMYSWDGYGVLDEKYPVKVPK